MKKFHHLVLRCFFDLDYRISMFENRFFFTRFEWVVGPLERLRKVLSWVSDQYYRRALPQEWTDLKCASQRVLNELTSVYGSAGWSDWIDIMERQSGFTMADYCSLYVPKDGDLVDLSSLNRPDLAGMEPRDEESF